MLIDCLHTIIRDRAFTAGRAREQQQAPPSTPTNHNMNNRDPKMSCDLSSSSMVLNDDDRPVLKHFSDNSCGGDTADTDSVSSDNSTPTTSSTLSDSLGSLASNKSGSALLPPRSCFLITKQKKQRKNVTIIEDVKRNGSPRAAPHVMEEHEVEQMWYTQAELQAIHRDMILVQAPTVVSSKENPRAAQWWKTLFYFHKEHPAPTFRDEKVILMRAKLVLTYVQAQEIIGLERILLGLLNQGYTAPRKSLLEWIQQQPKGCATTESIAAFQRRVSLPFRLFARELAVAQADALVMQEMPTGPVVEQQRS